MSAKTPEIAIFELIALRCVGADAAAVELLQSLDAADVLAVAMAAAGQCAPSAVAAHDGDAEAAASGVALV